MRYRITPFNIGALVMAGLIGRCFNQLNKLQSVVDAHGFDASLGLIPLIILGIVLFVADRHSRFPEYTRF